MAVTIERTGNPVFPWRVTTECVTKAEAFAKATRIEEIDPESFIPVESVALQHATEAPLPPFEAELPPAAQALMDLQDEDAPTSHLKAGEALNPPADDAE